MVPGRIAGEIEAQRALLRSPAGRVLAAGLGALALVTIIGMAILWPGGVRGQLRSSDIVAIGIQPATVTAVTGRTCPVETLPGCARVDFRLTGGLDAGRSSYLVMPGDEAAPRLSPGDEIRVAPNTAAFGTAPPSQEPAGADPAQAPYGFVDFERRGSLLWLALAFVAVVVLLGRRVGALSLVGLVAGLVLITAFVVPAILNGSPPLAVGLVGSFAAMFVTIVLVYGVGAKSLAALLGTAASLAVTAVLAVIFVKAAHLLGGTSEDASIVRSLGGGNLVSLQGLVLAGILIGALGVLNDVTVGQASTVLALQRANPVQRFGELYRGAVSVGRDHLGAAVNTPAFAYAGASLPLLLIFSSQGLTFGAAINRQDVATEIVAALVGSIGLILAVPITSATAAWLAVRLPAAALPADEHAGHHH
jgi:uncharacterized membrane protein